MTPLGFIVVYDDDSGCYASMTWCPDCEGALEYAGPKDDVIVFPTRALARRAIDISSCYARLLKAQGKVHNTDFLEHRRHLGIRPCMMASTP